MAKNIINTLLLFLFLFSTGFSQKIIKCDNISSFSEGMASFEKDNLWGFINTKGEIIIQPKYRWAFGDPKFSNSLCRLPDPASRFWGYIDKKGNPVIDFNLNSATDFNDTIATNAIPASVKIKGSKPHWRLIDRHGNVIVEEFPNRYAFITTFIEGRARVSVKSKIGFIDGTGKMVVENKYEDGRDFSCGRAAVMLNGKWGFIDKNGNVKVDFKFTNEPQSFSDGRAFVAGQNYLYALIDTAGNIIVEPKYEQAFPFENGFAVVSTKENNNETFHIINDNGKIIKSYKPAKRDDDKIKFITGFVDGLAIVNQGYGANRGFINTKGMVAIQFFYTNLKPFNSGLAYAEQFDNKTKKLKKGFIDKKGKFVIVIEKEMF